jgi:hypothetical protein
MVQGKIQEGEIEIIRRRMEIDTWPWLIPTSQHNEVMYAYPAKQNGFLQRPKPAEMKQVIYVYTVAPQKLEKRYIKWSSDHLMFFFPDRTPGSLVTYFLGKIGNDFFSWLL